MKILFLWAASGLFATLSLAQEVSIAFTPAKQPTAFAASPFSPNLVLAGTFSRGLFRTTNSGDTWEAIWTPSSGVTNGLVTAIQFDPHWQNTVYSDH